MRRRIGLALTVLLMGACAAAPDAPPPSPRTLTDAQVEQYNAQVAPEERIVCREETPVGSNIPRRVCRRVLDIQETSSFHREQLRNVLR